MQMEKINKRVRQAVTTGDETWYQIDPSCMQNLASPRRRNIKRLSLHWQYFTVD
jgi:ABC-type long-subunit fatty acid transport system fused permease/ATPase subunit